MTVDGTYPENQGPYFSVDQELQQIDRMYEIAGLARQLDDSEAKLKAAHDTIETQAGVINRLETEYKQLREAALDVVRLAENLAEDFVADGHRWVQADSEKFQRLWDILADIDETLKAQS